MAAGVAWQGVQEVLGDARATIDASISELQAKVTCSNVVEGS